MPLAPPAPPPVRRARGPLIPAPHPATPPVSGLRRGRPFEIVGERVLLEGADWAEYVALSDHPGNRRRKMTFDGPTGRLEIEMAVSKLHEIVLEMLGTMVAAYRRERRIRVKTSGALSLRSELLDRGADGDRTYYVSGLDRMPEATAEVLDLDGGDAPPDLVIEVDVTNPSVPKLPIYAALGVSEVWTWSAHTVTCRRLNDAGEYEEAADSGELPAFPFAFAADFIRDHAGADDPTTEDALLAHLRGAAA